MSKTCLIVADDPTARTKLRRIVEGLGLETLEAASVRQAKKCLSPSLAVVMVVENAPDRENLSMVFNDLPGMRTPDSPKRIAFETPDSRGGTVNAHIVARLQDADADSVGGMFLGLGL